MNLRNINFGPAWLGSGAGGFFGEGYWFHFWCHMLFYNSFCPDEFTFVAKTTTWGSRLGQRYGEEGNMMLQGDLTPKDLFPDCISADFLSGRMLNAVGLAGPGARDLLLRGEWQKRKGPFFVSFMTTKKGEEAIREMELFKMILKDYLSGFSAPIGLQINLSCPNAGVDLEKASQDACEALNVFASLGIPLVPKFNLLTPVEVVKMVAEHPACDAIQVSNTIPWGAKGTGIGWEKLFGSKGISPLAQYGGGGLSGAPLLPLVCDWIKAARKAGITKPINAGGGILCAADVDRVKEAGANGISIATAVALRPWRLRSILDRTNEIFPT